MSLNLSLGWGEEDEFARYQQTAKKVEMSWQKNGIEKIETGNSCYEKSITSRSMTEKKITFFFR